MEWADFKTRHEDCTKAFEALGRHLFSKWCSYTYGEDIERIIYTDGKGGDGGVEAFARHKDGSVIGLQAKWFREKFDDKQVKQLHKSIKSATQRHPTLTRYIVCMPLELQASRGAGNKGKSQVDRWEEFDASYNNIEFIFWGDMPLLLAWSCSSVVAKRVRAARTQLAIWGSLNPKEMAILLSELESCNDYQILESILTAAVGAACCTEDRDGLHALSAQCSRMFFSESPTCSTRNSVCRHAARIVVERAYAYDLISESQVGRARPPYQAGSQLLAYMKKPEGWSENPISGDLERYVVKQASRLFFEQIRKNNFCSEDEVRYPKSEVAKAVVERRIDLEEKAYEKVEVLWAQMEAARRKRESIWNASSRDYRPISNKILDEEIPSENQDVENELDLDVVKAVHMKYETEYSPEAESLMDNYKKIYGLDVLTPEQLRDGLILDFVYSQGWDADVFYGKPNGGEEGEILGADVSISREHYPATHGARSPIASFAEKYIWLAINEVAGDFADRLPIKDFCNAEFEPVMCFSDVGEEMPDPFDGRRGVEYGPDSGKESRFPDHFWQEYHAQGDNQLQRSTDWVNNAEWPKVEKVISAGRQLSICSWIHGVEAHSAASQMSRITCLLVPRSQFEIFKRDALAGAIVPRCDVGDVRCAGIDGACYHSPSVVCWAPFVKTIDDCDESYDSLDSKGDLFSVELRYLSAKTHWLHDGGETMLYFPSPFYSKSLGIVRGDGAKDYREFADKDGLVVATFERLDLGVSETVEHLQIDSDRLDDLLMKEDSVAVWFAEIYREVRPEFIPEKQRRHTWARRRMSVVCAKEPRKEVQCLSSIEVDG
ncbi:hypothetical protein [Tichowtungia aerotolerans]|uniref:Uncharacterized protein n=1 Tax=Tichowtungia aerotolerans TaxID=2697043 RepID=A0A6P1M1B3_9BACT|nr:hypothetical protein [Tichowtungia aerotolerans]QHI68370.1 hypothetical protein GT409_02495 [Tichowtungia aerotolerans]